MVVPTSTRSDHSVINNIENINVSIAIKTDPIVSITEIFVIPNTGNNPSVLIDESTMVINTRNEKRIFLLHAAIKRQIPIIALKDKYPKLNNSSENIKLNNKLSDNIIDISYSLLISFNFLDNVI